VCSRGGPKCYTRDVRFSRGFSLTV
jgi:hypothetical protein